MINIKKILPLVGSGLLLGLVSANGSLIGDTVGTRYFGSGQNTGVQSSVVGPGEEGNFFGNQFYDYGAFDFAIRSTSSFSGIFNSSGTVSLELSSLNFPGPLTSVSFATNLTGVTSATTANSVTFTWNEQPISPTTYLTANFNSQRVPDGGSSALLLGASLLGIGAVRRKFMK